MDARHRSRCAVGTHAGDENAGMTSQANRETIGKTSPVTTRLVTRAEMRVTGSTNRAAVVCVNGGQGKEVPGTWSASLEWLVRTLAPQLPELGFIEVKHRIKSWQRMD